MKAEQKKNRGVFEHPLSVVFQCSFNVCHFKKKYPIVYVGNSHYHISSKLADACGVTYGLLKTYHVDPKVFACKSEYTLIFIECFSTPF